MARPAHPRQTGGQLSLDFGAALPSPEPEFPAVVPSDFLDALLGPRPRDLEFLDEVDVIDDAELEGRACSVCETMALPRRRFFCSRKFRPIGSTTWLGSPLKERCGGVAFNEWLCLACFTPAGLEQLARRHYPLNFTGPAQAP